MSSLKYAGNGGGGIAPGPTSKKKKNHNKYYIKGIYKHTYMIL